MAHNSAEIALLIHSHVTACQVQLMSNIGLKANPTLGAVRCFLFRTSTCHVQ